MSLRPPKLQPEKLLHLSIGPQGSRPRLFGHSRLATHTCTAGRRQRFWYTLGDPNLGGTPSSGRTARQVIVHKQAPTPLLSIAMRSVSCLKDQKELLAAVAAGKLEVVEQATLS